MGNEKTYDTVYAPPATVLWQARQFQIPTECLLTVVFPQKVQTYLACWVISIFLTCFRREAPYLYKLNKSAFTCGTRKKLPLPSKTLIFVENELLLVIGLLSSHHHSPPTTRSNGLDMVYTYLVPYLPVTPTFLVLFVIFAVVLGWT